MDPNQPTPSTQFPQPPAPHARETLDRLLNLALHRELKTSSDSDSEASIKPDTRGDD
jgi:hypothetical protein